jgi:hypothetical protein
MVDDALAKDYLSLGVRPDASLLEVERAYFHMRSLYAEGSLASYGLLESPQQDQRLQEIEAAFARIVASRRQLAPQNPPRQANQVPAGADDGLPAAQLKGARLHAHLTLKELASTLKIGYLHLQNIEEENFADLPATVYLRGFLLSYAKALKISEPEDLAHRYLARRALAAQKNE